MHKIGLYILILVFFGCNKKDVIVPPFPVPEKPKYIPVITNADSYTRIQYGNMPLVISVPHDGTLQPAAIPDRTCAGAIVRDFNTISLLLAIDSVAGADYNIKPSWIYTDLSRIKLDQNREITEATCGNQSLNQYWNNYHNGIDSCINKLLSRYQQCIFIDLHGHGHAIQRSEIGYLISDTQLRNPASLTFSGTSLFNAAGIFSGKSVQQMVMGSTAFGTYLLGNGFPAVPSATIPAPALGEPYFNGGFNTGFYTGSAYPKVFGWQIETNFTGLRDSYVNRTAFAKAFMRSVISYFNDNTTMKSSGFGY